ncbi:pyrroline-5-carboxylate reductase [Aaosphaeria arxii CBS 175.79]|uniref:Proline dehydrogenase n=1 Tax=Aaosphaeria arxii CBS 175.79 TaxID=1450172 RepID=A0A6A5Y1K5_9PLEO|nr:pyrroline-5-carboxylate reductase [Aaosphaeria arxii CBS 175.79]KAF2019445.1 pyrroline-5-carboxylate reductase [Aaosphaeria arxii CBS 175.79]
MPTGMLLRSLLIATISSNRFLLSPSLSLLAFFSKPGRSYLFDVDRNPVLHALLKRTLYNQFCAGESEQSTRKTCRALKDLGFKGVILTYAKEIVFDHSTNTSHGASSISESELQSSSEVKHDAEIAAWAKGTLDTIDLISEGDVLALKTTGAGITVGKAFNNGDLPPQQMLDALDEISTRCKERGIKIIVDAESQHFQKGIARVTLELMRKFNRDGYAVIYNTYQAYLKGTPAVLAHHLSEAEKDGFTLGLKLVRGAYIYSDDRALIHDTKQDTDNAYNTIAQGALRQHIGDFGGQGPNARKFPSVNLFLASHNRESVIEAQRLYLQRTREGKPTVPVSFAQLHGMSDEVSFSLLQEKEAGQGPPDVYKCSTWGSMGDRNLGTAILKSLLQAQSRGDGVPNCDRFVACVHSEGSEKRLSEQFADEKKSGKLSIRRGENVAAVEESTIVVLGVDPADVEETLRAEGIKEALKGKLLISIAAGWTRAQIEDLLKPFTDSSASQIERTWVLRTLPNMAAVVSQSITAIEEPEKGFPDHYREIADAILKQIGGTVNIQPRLMDAFTAVGGSTPAFFAVICDAFIDAAVAVGMPRAAAQSTIYQSMKGVAEMLQSGIHPGVLKDQGTSPEGCTIGGLMVLEEAGVRGHLGKSLREAVTLARLMGGDNPHVNDTRH